MLPSAGLGLSLPAWRQQRKALPKPRIRKETHMAEQLENSQTNSGISRRGFIKSCSVAAAALGLSEAMIPKLVEAAESAERPTVIWLHFQECTGCTESLLRGSPSGYRSSYS